MEGMIESSNEKILLVFQSRALVRAKNQGFINNSTKSSIYHQPTIHWSQWFQTYMKVKSCTDAMVVKLHCWHNMFTFINVNHKYTAMHGIISKFHTNIRAMSLYVCVFLAQFILITLWLKTGMWHDNNSFTQICVKQQLYLWYLNKF